MRITSGMVFAHSFCHPKVPVHFNFDEIDPVPMKRDNDKYPPQEASSIDYLFYVIAGGAILSVVFSLLLWLQG